MSIPFFINKIKGVERGTIISCLVVIFVGIGSFYLGKMSISTLDHEKFSIVNNSQIGQERELSVDTLTSSSASSVEKDIDNSYVYVASKNGKLYYRIGCGASKRILPENEVYFQSESEALSAGYQASESCTP